MKPVVKISVVGAGYVAAIILACAAVAIRVARLSGPDAQAAGGMYAFGDSVLFVAVFGVAALVPTGAALFFLRPYRAFWYAISGLGLIVAGTGVVAAALYAFGRHAAEPSPLAIWAALSVLRILIAPVLALTFLVATVLSPYRVSRFAFLVATVMEASVTAYAVLVWFVPLLFNKS
jgi:hypothetical protein